MMKKLISCILVFLMLFTAVSFAQDFAEQTPSETEIITQRELDILTALGIIMPGDPKPLNHITRAEVSVVAMRMLGIEDDLPTFKNANVFTDVTAEHWAASAINAAYSMGLLHGYTDGTFEPDAPITFEQAMKIAVCLLGYRDYAEETGGYPQGYINTAHQKGITKGVICEYSADLTRGTFFRMMFHSLEVPLLIGTSYHNGQQQYTQEKGKSILTEYLFVVRRDGVVTANSYLNLMGGATPAKGKIIVNGVEYLVGTTDAHNYVGHSVRLYAKFEDAVDSSYEILYIEASAKDSYFEIKARDIETLSDVGGTNPQLYYKNEKDNPVKVSLAGSMTVVYNGKEEVGSSLSAADLTLSSGGVKLFDTDTDGRYDVISITKYETYVAESVSKSDDVFTDKYGKEPVYCDPDSVDKTVIFIDSAGNTLDMAPTDMIKRDSVVSVAMSKDKSIVTVVYCDGFASGVITEIFDRTAVIDAEEYDIADNLNQNDIRVGLSGQFYLNADGQISEFKASAEGVDYGYVIGVSRKTGLEEAVSLKLFSVEKKATDTYTLNQKIKLDGNGGASPSDAYMRLRDNKLSETVTVQNFTSNDFMQLVRFKANEENVISFLDTLYPNSDGDADELVLSIPRAKYTWIHNSRQFGGLFDFDTKTKIIMLPVNLDKAEKMTQLFTMPANVGSGRVFDLETYNNSEGRIAKIIVVYGDPFNTSGSSTAEPFLVETVTTAVDEDGDPNLKVRGYYKGVKQSYFVDSSDETLLQKIRQLRAGDVAVMSFFDNTIVDIKMSHSVADNVNPYNSDLTQDRYNYRTFGPVTFYGEGQIRIQYGESIDANGQIVALEEQFRADTPKYVVNLSNGTVKLDNNADIMKGDMVLRHQVDRVGKMLVVYK